MKKLYYLGPKGTYSELACGYANKVLFFDYKPAPVSTIAKIIEMTSKSPLSCAVVPIENSIEGIVRQSLDAIYTSDVKIQAQFEVQIKHCLISKGKKDRVKNIVSHPQALAQCQKYILENFDENINLINVDSTSSALSFLKDKDETFAAIASKNSIYDSKFFILDENIGDIKDNKTRFVIVSLKDMDIAEKTRTSIAFNTKNEPAALLKILSIIAKYGLNLVYLESRPSKRVFGEYNFFADIDRGISMIEEPLELINKECNYYKFLGSYPSV